MSSVHFSAIIVGFAILLVISPCVQSATRRELVRLLDDEGGVMLFEAIFVIVGCALGNMIFNLNDGLVARGMFKQEPKTYSNPLPSNTSSLLLPRPHGQEPVSRFFLPQAIKTAHTRERILLRRRRQISNITKSTH